MKRAGKDLFGGQLEDLDRRRREKQQRDAEALERLAIRAGLNPQTAAMLALNLAPATQTDWTFVMISPAQNAAVIRWLGEHSKRPHKAVLLWSELFMALRADTGEILRSRQELAERVGMTPRDLSSTMTELASINAITRRKEGRHVRYFMNPNIATHIPTPEQRREARDNAGPLLTLMEGGKV
jgi:DNA-binding transcriptional ArsR family regulator